jgi:hypothetical protein
MKTSHFKFIRLLVAVVVILSAGACSSSKDKTSGRVFAGSPVSVTPVLLEQGFSLFQGDLEGPLVDREQPVTFPYGLAFLEINARDLSADLGLDGYHRNGLDPADRGDLERDVLLKDGGNGHGASGDGPSGRFIPGGRAGPGPKDRDDGRRGRCQSDEFAKGSLHGL